MRCNGPPYLQETNAKPIFQNISVMILTKYVVYVAVVLGILLYGSDTWTTKHIPTRNLETFHNCCLCHHMFSAMRSKKSPHLKLEGYLGKMVEEMVMLRHMWWLGQIARMPEHRMPNQILFGQLPKARPFHEVWQRWKDRVMNRYHRCTSFTFLHLLETPGTYWHGW